LSNFASINHILTKEKIKMNIRNISIAAFAGIIILSFTSCFKDETGLSKADEDRKANEQGILDEYIATNNITEIPNADGLYYIETLKGTGDSARMNTWMEIKFTGRLVSTNAVVMTNDSATAQSSSLYSTSAFYGPTRLILGQISYDGLNQGLIKMREGGKARLIFPSSLGLGQQSSQNIPSFSSMIFDVELVKVIPDTRAYENSRMMAYLEKDSISTDSTASGIYIKTKVAGTGDFPVSGNQVTVSYKGKFMSGRVFDSGAKPFTLVIGGNGAITGFEEGVKLVKKGGSATIVIPYYYAYGEFGRVDAYYRTLIPPFATLVFDISVTDIVK
jgi:FKBP-type peptidyl-prolyl cis-trans isomerase